MILSANSSTDSFFVPVAGIVFGKLLICCCVCPICCGVEAHIGELNGVVIPQNVLDCACNGGVVVNAGRCEVAGVVGEAGTCFFVCGKTLLAVFSASSVGSTD